MYQAPIQSKIDMYSNHSIGLPVIATPGQPRIP